MTELPKAQKLDSQKIKEIRVTNWDAFTGAVCEAQAITPMARHIEALTAEIRMAQFDLEQAGLKIVALKSECGGLINVLKEASVRVKVASQITKEPATQRFLTKLAVKIDSGFEKP